MYLDMLIREVMGEHGLGLITRLTMKRNEGNQRGNGLNIHRYEYPMVPHDYGCYVCGSTFETNQERLTHLENFGHIDLYNTGSPQEQEEIRRLSQ